MKVIFLRSNPVSPDSRVEKEINSLLKVGYDVSVFAWDRDSNYKIRKETLLTFSNTTDIFRVGILSSYGAGFKKNIIPLIRFQMILFFWLIKNRNKYDVIHACDFDTAFIAKLVSKMLSKKLVYDIFDFYIDAYHVPNKIKKYIKKLDYSIIKSADATIICTEKRKQQISGSSSKKLVVIHNTPPKINFSNDTPRITNNKIKVVYVGVLGEGRLIMELIEVMSNFDDFELHIAGFGKLENEIKKISEKFDNLYFYGKISYKQALELENESDIMLAIYDPEIANHFYAAPNKFYEALMLGKPLIMVNNTGMDEIIYQNNLGEIIDFNIESLEKGLLSLKNRSSEWESIKLKMQKIYEKDYSWNIMEKRLQELYRMLGE